MKRLLPFLLAFFLPITSHAFDGPLQMRNQFPLFMHLDAPYLEKAAMENSFSINLSHSSMYLVEDSDQWSAGLDMEITGMNLRFKRTVRDLFEVGIDVPVISLSSGFLDGFLESYHNAFGFPDYGRSERPTNDFLYEVKKEGKVIVKGRNGHIGLGDIRLSVKKPLLSGDTMVSLRADIEFPTGDADAGYGNGSFDAGFGLLIDKRLTEQIQSSINAGIVFPGDLKGKGRIGLREFVYGGVSVEALAWKRFSLLAQIFAQNSPFPETGIGEIDRPAVLLSFGGRYRSGVNMLELSLTEDPNTAGAPDFTLAFSYRRSL
jgi:hypothetical protein